MQEDGWSSPAIDMYQTNDEVIVKAAEVQINVSRDVLTIKGEMKQEEEKKDKAWHIGEQRWVRLSTRLCFPLE